MMSVWMYYSLAALLFVSNAGGFIANFAGLPGNWWILGGTAIFCYLVHASNGTDISWNIVGLLCLLAVIGEIVEFVAATAGAAKQGASRRAMVLSVVGGVGGSVGGAFLGVLIPVPLLGSALGAIIGGAVGAAAGAVLGEDWKGTALNDALQVGKGAFVGRILGTVGKVVLGGIMVVIATVDSLL